MWRRRRRRQPRQSRRPSWAASAEARRKAGVPQGDRGPEGEAGARREPGRPAHGPDAGLYPAGEGSSVAGDGAAHDGRPSPRSHDGGPGIQPTEGDRAGDPLQEQPLPHERHSHGMGREGRELPYGGQADRDRLPEPHGAAVANSDSSPAGPVSREPHEDVGRSC